LHDKSLASTNNVKRCSEEEPRPHNQESAGVRYMPRPHSEFGQTHFELLRIRFGIQKSSSEYLACVSRGLSEFKETLLTKVYVSIYAMMTLDVTLRQASR
jgi:hypothetical protein